MTTSRDPKVAALVDEVMSMAPAPPHFPDSLHKPASRRRHLIGFAVVAVAVSIGALIVVAPWSRTTHKPSIVSPARRDTSPSTEPPVTTTLPLLTADQAMQTPGDQRVEVVDRTGTKRGWVIHGDLYGQDLSKPVLVRVYNDAGQTVGYYSNMSGFVETADAQAADFDAIQHDLKALAASGASIPDAIRNMTTADYNRCLQDFHDSATGATPPPLSAACKELFRAVGGPVVGTNP
jgi:hypothetical protein